MEEKVEKSKEVCPKLSLHWNFGEHHLRLKGTWEGKEIDTELQAPDVSFEEIWDALLADEGLCEDWVREQQALRVSFDEAHEVQRETMSRDLKFRNPSLSDYGDFESFDVRQVNITPRSQDDARQWATWRLKARIGDFATSKLYDEWWKEASEPFSEFLLECPTRSDLAALMWESAGERPDTRAWHLMAAEDWNLK